ncbi:hypothetical protein IKL45_00275 [Candidatus Saccharibacteria bacterium]|nr:hypothetical protein [Candidatus Saccharibacteria bacterium]MBR6122541.1 hypothetical protein [Candidatus Saccharibacteria bacterium]
MFTHLLPNSDSLLRVTFSDFAKKHFLKSFQKRYKGKQWELTEESIKQDLARLRIGSNTIQETQQIDELYHEGEYWIAKYDFRIAGTKQSTKTSGNRCIIFIDNGKNRCEILLIYSKTDLPANKKETQYINDILEKEFPEYYHIAR